MASLPSPPLLLFLFSFFPFFLLSSSSSPGGQTTFQDVNLGNPILHIVPSPVERYSSSAKDIASCERVRLVGLSRVNLSSYASSFRISVKASDGMPERHHSEVEVCFHRNASIGLCQCEKEEWGNLHQGQWAALMSPYENRYIDIKFANGISGSITISLEEEIQHWRLVCLGLGFVLLLLAPIVSKWAPFYYSSSMALGILLVVLILLFQGMKLLPTGRKNFLYLTIYGSVLGVGSLLVHYFSMFVNSILLNFGLSEDMHNPVSVFVFLGVVLAGAALGYWIVRKFVLSEDGTVDSGIAQFVKWAMRIIAIVFISQSSPDSLLAVTALVICWTICSVVTSSKWRRSSALQSYSVKENLWQQRAKHATANHRHAEFLSHSTKSGLKGSTWGSPPSPYSWSNSPSRGLVLSAPRKRAVQQQDYYSTFHRTPVRKFSKKEWDDFTHESTRNALADWASTPEVCDWIAQNAHRIHLGPKEISDDSIESSSGSSEETIEKSGIGLFRWL